MWNIFPRRRPCGFCWIHELSVVGPLAVPFLLLMVLMAFANPTSFDRTLASDLQGIPWGGLRFIPRAGSEIGGGAPGMYWAPLTLAAVLAATKRWRWLALLGVVFLLHFVMISPKQFIVAYRPSPVFGVEGGGGLESFPSGHVEWATSFYGFVAYIGWRTLPERFRPWIIATFALIVAGTMLGRVEVGRHWPLDTVGGVLAGLIALRLVVLLDEWRPGWQPRWLRTPEGAEKPAEGAMA